MLKLFTSLPTFHHAYEMAYVAVLQPRWFTFKGFTVLCDGATFKRLVKPVIAEFDCEGELRKQIDNFKNIHL
jgi:hypothetical protein